MPPIYRRLILHFVNLYSWNVAMLWRHTIADSSGSDFGQFIYVKVQTCTVGQWGGPPTHRLSAYKKG